MSYVIERFTTSAERMGILRGLLRYRAVLRARGLYEGFQWLDGSFVEQKEHLEGCAPKDIDVVTFFSLPAGVDELTFLSGNFDIFDPDLTSQEFKVDAYPFVLGKILTPDDVRQISYWYSMWSHRRTGVWKGFVQVDLSDDDMAFALLNDIEVASL